MINASNLTHEEFYKLNGTLTHERVESVLTDLAELQAFDVREFAPCAQEARGCYIPEDFLQERISDLQALAKRMRGDNKRELLDIIEMMESNINDAVASAEYGASELDKIIRTIKR